MRTREKRSRERLLRRVQRDCMTEQFRLDNAKFNGIGAGTVRPDYKTPAYETLNEYISRVILAKKGTK